MTNNITKLYHPDRGGFHPDTALFFVSWPHVKRLNAFLMDFNSKYKGSEIKELLLRSRAAHVTRELDFESYGTEMRDILPADLGNDVIVT